MVLTYNINDKVRFIVLYQDVTQSPSRISRIIKVSISTIHNWIKKIREDQDILKIQEGRGRKPQISQATIHNLVRACQRSPEKCSTRKLAAAYGLGKSTVHRILVEQGLKYKAISNDIQLSKKELDERVTFCQNMLKRNYNQLYNTFFSDEMGINLWETHISKAWTSPLKKIKIEKPRDNVSLNCWGAISYEGATSLHIWKGPLNSETYKKILSAHIDEMKEIYQQGFQFQQDNHKAHRAVETWERAQGLNIVKFPIYSPQLTPIENVWGALKAVVATETPKNEAQLIRSLEKNWKILTTSTALKPYFDRLPAVYTRCIENHGVIDHS